MSGFAQVGKLWVSIGLKTEEFNKGLQGFRASMAKIGVGMMKTGTILTAGLTAPMVLLGKTMLDQAMYLEATEAKYNTVFAGMTDTVDAFIKEFQKLTPATTAEASGVASSIQDLLVPMDFLREDATALTGDFMHLIGALTNFNSAEYTTAEVADKVKQALVGQKSQ